MHYTTPSIVTLAALFTLGCSPGVEQSPVNIVHNDFAAHWVTQDTVLLPQASTAPVLLQSASAALDDGADADSEHTLTEVALPDALKQRYPHLTGYTAYRLAVTTEQAKTMLKGQLAVRHGDAKQATLSYVQTYGVLDALYTSGPDDADEISTFGATLSEGQTTFTLWAPTAKSVSVQLFDGQKQPLPEGRLALREDALTGAWSVSTDNAPQGTFFKYQLEVYHPQNQAIETLAVTDPYSLSLSTNSEYSQVVNLASADTQPEGWRDQPIPTLARPEQHILYEVHIRDFSASDSALSHPVHQGKYAAFSEVNSFGMRHLRKLREAGLNTVHLLPTYDISTVNEDPSRSLALEDSMAKVCELVPEVSACGKVDESMTLLALLEQQDPESSDAQTIIEPLRAHDRFNWGYDPYHYTVPEGSYALNPDGLSRIREFREMVKSLHEEGFRVVMDVVYNHTFAAGLNEKSVLDKVVPNYYHRLNPLSGKIEQSTCCDNSATEHRMMAKLMIDSLVVWASHYNIDGFRFDLMGHQPKDAMLEARAAVQAVDTDTYFYGEGWNFGEVANNAQFVQASQLELAGTEIGTFTDRLRDAVRGGSSFVSGDEIRFGQGIGNGLVNQPNELQSAEKADAQRQEYLLSLDQIRVGLAGNLATFPLKNAAGETITGKDLDYGGGPTGYALDPADTINYVSKHDNQTLWDNNQYRIANAVSTEDRVRMQMLSLAYPLYAQGIPFLHMGSELLRSKGFLRDSYDYNDWFNRVDFSMQHNNYNTGLPPAEKDEANWQVIRTLRAQNEGRDQVSPADIRLASEVFMDMLRIRSRSPLFSLGDAQAIHAQVSFHNTGDKQVEGVIMMLLDDLQDADPTLQRMMVVFNNTADTLTLPFEHSAGFALHPVLKQGADERMKSARADENGFTVPGLSAAVFVQ